MENAPYSLLAALESVSDRERPPVHLWHPEVVRDIDLEIRRDGTWLYMGSPISRPRLVRLFASVLVREGDEYYLVTPVEKCRIRVEDVPFQAILLEISGEGEDQVLRFTTDMAEQVEADRSHPLRFDLDPDSQEPSPYLLVRDGLEARLVRSVYYQLAERVVTRSIENVSWLGVWSRGHFFPLMKA